MATWPRRCSAPWATPMSRTWRAASWPGRPRVCRLKALVQPPQRKNSIWPGLLDALYHQPASQLQRGPRQRSSTWRWPKTRRSLLVDVRTADEYVGRSPRRRDQCPARRTDRQARHAAQSRSGDGRVLRQRPPFGDGYGCVQPAGLHRRPSMFGGVKPGPPQNCRSRPTRHAYEAGTAPQFDERCSEPLDAYIKAIPAGYLRHQRRAT